MLTEGIGYSGVIDGPIKWSQPTAFETGIDIHSEDTGPWIADDFQCLDGLPVAAIHWWGSYVPSPGQAIVKPTHFTIAFLSDVPAGSYPGPWFYSIWLPFELANETDTEKKGANGLEIYQYSISLRSRTMVDQEKDHIYWISISAGIWVEQVSNWGWHTSLTHWNDFAVQSLSGEDWQPLQYDMAFELTTVPLPPAILLVGCGLLTLLGKRKMRRLKK